METRVAEYEDKLQNTDDILSEMITTQEMLQFKLISLEAYSRRETLRLYVPDGVESGKLSMIYHIMNDISFCGEVTSGESLHPLINSTTDPEGTQSIIMSPTRWLPA